MPLTALTALQALELMNPKSGETIFISGGTGSLGAMAIPVAKSYGLTVITNGSAANKDRVCALGADRFIDYKTEDYAEVLSDVDYVLDTLGTGSFQGNSGFSEMEESWYLSAGCRMESLPFVPECRH